MWFGQKLYRIDGREVWSRWQPFDTEQAAIRAGCDFITVLELACSVADYRAWENRKSAIRVGSRIEHFQAPFRGPFYADFDTKGPLDHLRLDLGQRLARIANRFHLDPNQFNLWYTGGRGFHWILPAGNFTEPDFQHPHLPRIHRRFAERLGLMRPTTHHPDGLADRAVYSAGRGRMWRTEGHRRPNGQAKIRITFEDLRHRTAEELIEQSKQAYRSNRTKTATMSPARNPALARLFEEIIAEIETESKRQSPRRSRSFGNPKSRARTHQSECQDWQHIQQTLDRLPSATANHYDTWLKVGMILHDASGGSDQGFRQWVAWSNQSPKFDNNTCSRKWASFRSGLVGGLTIRTLYHLVGDEMCGI